MSSHEDWPRSYVVLGAWQKAIANLIGYTDTKATALYTRAQADSTAPLVELHWQHLSGEGKGSYTPSIVKTAVIPPLSARVGEQEIHQLGCRLLGREEGEDRAGGDFRPSVKRTTNVITLTYNLLLRHPFLNAQKQDETLVPQRQSRFLRASSSPWKTT